MADPDIIASAVANKASFRMTIPIHIAKKQPDFDVARHAIPTETESTDAIWNLLPHALSQKDMHLPTF
jgi:hypothetical protein